MVPVLTELVSSPALITFMTILWYFYVTHFDLVWLCNWLVIEWCYWATLLNFTLVLICLTIQGSILVFLIQLCDEFSLAFASSQSLRFSQLCNSMTTIFPSLNFQFHKSRVPTKHWSAQTRWGKFNFIVHTFPSEHLSECWEFFAMVFPSFRSRKLTCFHTKMFSTTSLAARTTTWTASAWTSPAPGSNLASMLSPPPWHIIMTS